MDRPEQARHTQSWEAYPIYSQITTAKAEDYCPDYWRMFSTGSKIINPKNIQSFVPTWRFTMNKFLIW